MVLGVGLFRIALGALGICLILAGIGMLSAGVLLGLLAPKARKSGGSSCHACGYDLGGLTGPRCPECGQVQPHRWDLGDSMSRLGLNRADRLLTLGAVAVVAGLVVLALA